MESRKLSHALQFSVQDIWYRVLVSGGPQGMEE